MHKKRSLEHPECCIRCTSACGRFRVWLHLRHGMTDRANFFLDNLVSGEKCFCACAVWIVMVTYRWINPLHASKYWLLECLYLRVQVLRKILMLSSRCVSFVFGMWWCTSLHTLLPPAHIHNTVQMARIVMLLGGIARVKGFHNLVPSHVIAFSILWHRIMDALVFMCASIVCCVWIIIHNCT